MLTHDSDLVDDALAQCRFCGIAVLAASIASWALVVGALRIAFF